MGGAVDAGDADAGNAPTPPTGDCPYPAGAPASWTNYGQMKVGTVVPNFEFFKEDGTKTSFGAIRCERKDVRLIWWFSAAHWCTPCQAAARAARPLYRTTVAAPDHGLLRIDSMWPELCEVPADGIGEWKRETMALWTVLSEPEPDKHMPWNPGFEGAGYSEAMLIDVETMKIVSLGLDDGRGADAVEGDLANALKRATPRR
jgi:hypothetical protein